MISLVILSSSMNILDLFLMELILNTLFVYLFVSILATVA